MNQRLTLILILAVLAACQPAQKTVDHQPASMPFTWNNATVYFLMTDRFYNGSAANDYEHTAENPPAPYRGFMGGDIKGITEKIREGYFNELGVDALWMTPVVEQISSSVDEGTGNSFAFHGYWTRDWTAFDSRFGTAEDFKEMVDVAHEHGIRILVDAVANHTGPVTPKDPAYPDNWVKTEPQCTYQDFASTVNCTLVENLPDIRTETEEEVDLPPFLIAKWKAEGRYEKEVKELEEWFTSTGLKRTPTNYILKWLVDFVKEYGVDGYRVDTVKHTEGYVWSTLYQEAVKAWESYKKHNPKAIIDPKTPFYMVGEVYNYYISSGQNFNYGDTTVNFFNQGFDALINFDFKTDAHNDYEEIFTKYGRMLHNELKGKTVLNYVSSHDDGGPFDKMREKPIEAGTKLLLCPGGAQIYYGDESARSLSVEAQGDATLRSFMNWEEIKENTVKNGVSTKEILTHWQKLGRFRKAHPAIGAGYHKMITKQPYVFSRTWSEEEMEDKVVIGLDLPTGHKTLSIGDVFAEGMRLTDKYSGESCVVKDGKIEINTEFPIVLLEIEHNY